MFVPVEQDSIIAASDMTLEHLSDPSLSTPNYRLEGIVSMKSILRGLVSGALVVCEQVPEGDSPQE